MTKFDATNPSPAPKRPTAWSQTNPSGASDTYAFVSKTPGGGLSVDEARQLQARAMETIRETGPISAKINAAARLMTAGAFREAADAYAALAQAHPEQRGLCEGQIGAAYYFLGDYKRAVGHYLAAIAHGDTDHQQDNLFEAAEAQWNEHGDPSLLEGFLESFPIGLFAGAARRLLGRG